MVSLCAIGGCDTARCTFSYRVRLRAYACGTGWLWVCLHYGVTVSSCAVIGPSRNGTSADHKPALFHRDGVGI